MNSENQFSKDGKSIYFYSLADGECGNIYWSFQKVSKEKLEELIEKYRILVDEWNNQMEKMYYDNEDEDDYDPRDSYPDFHDAIKQQFGMERLETDVCVFCPCL